VLCIAALVAVMPKDVEGAEVWGATNGNVLMHYPLDGGLASSFSVQLPTGAGSLTDLEVIPEPSSFFLVTIGLFALTSVSRFRRR
jgi:hypothetical protein